VKLSEEERKWNQEIIGFSIVPIESRFSEIWRVETNLGNFLADLANYLS